MQQQRPTGVTILGILAIIGGILGLCGGVLGLLGGALAGSVAAGTSPYATAGTTTQLAADAGILIVLSVFVLVLAVLDIVLGVGALQLRPWAWPLGVGLMAVTIILDIVDIVISRSFFSPIIGIVVSAIILYYLYQPNVQKAFGRA